MKIIFAILVFALVAAADELPEVDEKGIKDLIKKMHEAISTGEKHLLQINNIPGAEGIVERVDEATDKLGHFVYHLKKAQTQCRKVTDADRIRCRRLLRIYYVYYKSKALELIESIENDSLRVIPLPPYSAAYQSEATEPIVTIEDDAYTVIPLPSNSTSSKTPADEIPEVDEKGIKDLIKKMHDAINTGEKHLLKINNIPGAEGFVESVDEATDKLGHFVYHLKKAQTQCRKVTDADRIRCRRLLRIYYVYYKSKALELIESIENDSLRVIPLPPNSAAYQSEATEPIVTIEDDASTVIPLPSNSTSSKTPADEIPEVDEKGIKDLIKKMLEAINTGEKHLLKINNIPGAEGIVKRVDEATDKLGHLVYHLRKAQKQCRRVTDADLIRCRRLIRMYYVHYKSKALELIESIETEALRVIPLPPNSATYQSEASEPIVTIEDNASTVIPLPSNSASYQSEATETVETIEDDALTAIPLPTN